MLEGPLITGLTGAALLPVLPVIAAAAALATRCTVVVERDLAVEGGAGPEDED